MRKWWTLGAREGNANTNSHLMKVAIVHPWLPQYRLRFFEQLKARAAEENIAISVYYGEAPPEWKERRDTVSSPIATRLDTRFITFAGRTLIKKDIRCLVDEGPFDLVIVEHAIRNLETFSLLREYGRERIGFWGHGKTYTKKVTWLQEKLKFGLARRGSWFFAYTEQGMKSMVSHGMPRNRTTVLNNSFDTRTLARLVASISEDEIRQFSKKIDLQGSTALFLGGLDSSKRLPFLIEAGKLIRAKNPKFRLVICGAGEDWKLLSEMVEDLPWAIMLGPVFDSEKALVLASCQVLAMPGRVGLVALDSFAAGIPIVTTEWPWHAPEFEYLDSGSNALVTANSLEDFADGLAEALGDLELQSRLQEGAELSATRYSVEKMVENFLDGLRRWREMRGGVNSASSVDS